MKSTTSSHDFEAARAAAEGEVFAFPASSSQRRLWFLSELSPDSPAYNVVCAFRLKGQLNVAALEAGQNEIIRRHESLRTTFALADGQLMQVVAPELRIPLPILDLSDLPPQDRETRTQEVLQKESRRIFDLKWGPLISTQLICLDRVANEYVWILNFHHIIADGSSVRIFLHELTSFYGARIQGSLSPLNVVQLQYADYAIWEGEQLNVDALKEHVDYWRKQLAGQPPLLQLPFDHQRRVEQTFRGSSLAFELDAKLSGELRALSQREGVTFFITLLAAFDVLLFRLTGRADLSVGVPNANRDSEEIDNVIGMFVNTIVFRTDMSGDPTFQQLLRRVRTVAGDASVHAKVPFERLVEELRVPRDASYNPLFQVMFVLQGAPVTLDLSGVEAALIDIDNGTAKFDLYVELYEEADRLRGRIEYSTDLFDASSVERFADYFVVLLRSVVDNPDARISALRLIPEAERRALLGFEGNTDFAYPLDQCVHDLFDAQAARIPDAVAAIDAYGRRLDYRMLSARSNQLAQLLRSYGVGPDKRVAIRVERSIEQMVAVLAVLKAGGAYVPLDPAYPDERLTYMLADSEACVLLTQRQLHGAGVSFRGPVWYLDDPLPPVSEELRSHPVSADHLAYVIYTSGSTGKPKGVAMPHRALVNLISWQLGSSMAGQADRTLQFASLSFDVSFQEIFSTWCSGGTLILMTEELRRDPVQLVEYVRHQEINRLFLPFVALQHLAEVTCLTGVAMSRSLREIITAGEQLRITTEIRTLFGRLPDCVLYNHYGPTEAHVVTSYRLAGNSADWPDLPPIGRPIPNTRVRLLDTNGNITPIGVPGELHIGGICLARGYLNQDELTAQKFIVDSLGTDDEARLYKTGDLARYRSDGNIQFLGRTDDQVKIRGFRIEPGEVEAAIARHSEVLEVVVDTWEQSGYRRLVAYVVPKDSKTASAAELRRWLKKCLPDYLIPSAFVFLLSLPLTPSGKIDRRSLPHPNEAEPGTSATPDVPRRIAPPDPVELKLIEIWKRVLGLSSVGVRDNFFDVGGHSLLAARLVARIQKEFATTVPLSALFRAPTIADLANLLRGGGGLPEQTRSIVVLGGEGARRFFCVHSIGGESFSFRKLASLLEPEYSLCAIEAPTSEIGDDIIDSVEGTARAYVNAVLAFQPQGPYYIGGWSSGSTVALEMAQQMTAAGHKVDLLVALDGAPYNTGVGTSRSNPVYYWKLLCNLPYWLMDDVLENFSLASLIRRIKNKLVYFGRKVIRMLLRRPLDPTAELEGFLDLPHLSTTTMDVTKRQFIALRNYVPKKFGGRVILYKSTTQPLYHLLEQDLAWQSIASDVEVVAVRGTHTSILRDPYVRAIGKDLKTRLNEAAKEKCCFRS